MNLPHLRKPGRSLPVKNDPFPFEDKYKATQGIITLLLVPLSTDFPLKKFKLIWFPTAFFSTDWVPGSEAARLGYPAAGLLHSHSKSTTVLPRADRAQRGWSSFLSGVSRAGTDAFTSWKEFQKPEQGRQHIRGLFPSTPFWADK